MADHDHPRTVLVDPDLARAIMERRDQGMNHSAIAKDLKLGMKTVREVIRAYGEPIQREAAIGMTQAARSATRRRNLEDRLMTRAEKLLTKLEEEEKGFSTVLREKGGAEGPTSLNFVPPQDERALAGAISQLAATANKLADSIHDQDIVAQSLLEQMAAELNIAEGIDR